MLLIYVTISTFLFSFSFPNPIINEGVAGLGLIALVPAWYAISQCYKIINVYRLGMYFGVLSTITSYYWLTRFGEFSIWTISGVSLVYFFEYAFLFVCIWLIIKYTTPLFRPIMLALIWTGFEYIKSIGYIAFPWTLLAHSVHQISALIQIVRITGTWGLSLLLAYGNALILEIIIFKYDNAIHTLNKKYTTPKIVYSHLIKHSICFGVFLMLSLIYGSVHQFLEKQTTPLYRIPILLVQQNVDSWDDTPRDQSLEHIIDLTDNSLKEIAKKNMPEPELILWSETTLVVPYQIEDTNSYFYQFYNSIPQKEPFLKFISRINIPIITGTPLYNEEDNRVLYNSAILITPDGQYNHQYGKNQLVPLAEYLPFYEYKIARDFMERHGIATAGWAPWGKYNTLTWDRERENTKKDHSAELQKNRLLYIGTPICFEDSFSYITRNFVLNGATLLVNLTNVSWSKTESAQVQQFVASKFRSIETGLTLVRTTNSGVSAIINPWGRVLARLPMFTSDSLYFEVPIYQNINTPYLILGDLIGILAFYISVIYVLCLLLKYTKYKNARIKETNRYA